MMKYVALDDGHGMETAGKRTPAIPELNGRVIRENEFNREVVKYLDIELKRHGFKTLLTAPTDSDTPLATRVNAANKAKVDLFISIHYNALNGKWGTQNGFSAHVQPGDKNRESGKFANITLKHLAQGTIQKNRGLVEQNLYVTRETKMPAVLFELGFMDNQREALLMINVSFQKECAMEIAKGVCEYYGVKYEESAAPITHTQPSTDVYHTVVKGDTLWGVATANGLKVAELKELNGLTSDLLTVGQKLRIKKNTTQVETIKTINGIKVVGTIRITNLKNFTYIYAEANENSTRLGNANKDAKFVISGSVPGWWEIIHNDKRAYVRDKYGVKV